LAAPPPEGGGIDAAPFRVGPEWEWANPDLIRLPHDTQAAD